MKTLTLALLSLSFSLTTLASSFSSCYCKGEISKLNIGSERYPVNSTETKTIISGLYTNKVTGEIQERIVSDISLNRGSVVDEKGCEQALEDLRHSNVCPNL